MVQLLLILNLIIVTLLLLVVGAFFHSLKRVSEKVEEIEAEELRNASRISELKNTTERLNDRLEFLQNQVKILITGFRRKGQ